MIKNPALALCPSSAGRRGAGPGALKGGRESDQGQKGALSELINVTGTMRSNMLFRQALGLS